MDTNKVSGRFFDIVGGPGKDALFDACKYADDKRASIKIYFSVLIGHTGLPDAYGSAYVLMDISDVIIRGIVHDDEVGEVFTVYGACRIGNGVTSSKDDYQFIAQYEPKIRRGEIRFIER